MGTETPICGLVLGLQLWQATLGLPLRRSNEQDGWLPPSGISWSNLFLTESSTTYNSSSDFKKSRTTTTKKPILYKESILWHQNHYTHQKLTLYSLTCFPELYPPPLPPRRSLTSWRRAPRAASTMASPVLPPTGRHSTIRRTGGGELCAWRTLPQSVSFIGCLNTPNSTNVYLTKGQVLPLMPFALDFSLGKPNPLLQF